MGKDDIFRTGEIDKDFVFNDRVAEVFDDMLDRSIPFYRQVINLTAQLLAGHLRQGDQVYDLGCATGTTLLELARHLEPLALEFIGVDNSAAMLQQAVHKAQMYARRDMLHFVEEDITRLKPAGTGAGAVILNYTLQFIRPLIREEFMNKVYGLLRPGGVLIVSEKLICHNPRLNRNFIEIHHHFKKAQGYSNLEIAKKREALENVLVPFSIKENLALLAKAGFSNTETFFQWCNFASFVAIK